MTEDGRTLRLFHGTTSEAARLIESEGFAPIGAEALVEEVAALYEVPVRLLQERLLAGGRYTTRDARPNWVSVASRFEVAAASWAQRAPEARWEALGVVYEHLLGLDSARESWSSTDDGQWWVQREMLRWTPAVVEIETDISHCWQTYFSGAPRRPALASHEVVEVRA